jgi:hypothetical protein
MSIKQTAKMSLLIIQLKWRCSFATFYRKHIIEYDCKELYGSFKDRGWDLTRSRRKMLIYWWINTRGILLACKYSLGRDHTNICYVVMFLKLSSEVLSHTRDFTYRTEGGGTSQNTGMKLFVQFTVLLPLNNTPKCLSLSDKMLSHKL